MASRPYSPIRIKNPTEGHLVPLLPNQDFVLIVDDPTAEVDINSNFFYLGHTESYTGFKSWHFRQKYNLDSWSYFSRTFLGVVSVLTDTYTGSLCVYLEAKNKVNISSLTAVNPHENFIKVTPSMLVEVVVFDEKATSDSWKFTTIPGKQGLKYELFDYKSLNLQDYDWTNAAIQRGDRIIPELCFSYPRQTIPGIENTNLLLEHHFWFRLNRESWAEMIELDPGSYSAGKIIVHNSSPDDTRAIFKSLKLDVNVKYKHKTLATKSKVDRYQESSPERYDRQALRSLVKNYYRKADKKHDHHYQKPKNKSYYYEPCLYKQDVQLKLKEDELFDANIVRYYNGPETTILLSED